MVPFVHQVPAVQNVRKSLRPPLAAAALAAALALAAPPPTAAAPAEHPAAWPAPWSWLARVWESVSSTIDPDGGAAPTAAPAEVSSLIDPNGQTAPPNEVGGAIAPDG